MKYVNSKPSVTYLYLVLFSILSVGCAGFKNIPSNYKHIDANNVKTINGEYSIFAKSKEIQQRDTCFDNANEKFYRKPGRGERDTVRFDSLNGGRFKINVVSKNEVTIEFFLQEKVIKSQTLHYKLKKDGFLYVKNRNTIITGIPFLFGGVDHRKVRIALSQNDDLIINDVFDSSGALLLIFGDRKVWENTNTYKRFK